MTEKIFCESQSFDIRWVRVSLLLLEFILISSIVFAVYDHRIIGIGAIIIPALLSLLPLIFLMLSYVTTLEVEITTKTIGYKWMPFQKKFRKIELADVKKIELTHYKFIGYGYRVSTKYGECHVLKGNSGLAVEMRHGKKYLIGTQKIKDLEIAVRKIHEKFNPE